VGAGLLSRQNSALPDFETLVNHLLSTDLDYINSSSFSAP